MIKNLILILLIFFVYRVVKKWMMEADKDRSVYPIEKKGPMVDDVMLKDPLCGVYFPKKDAISLKEDGKVLYFCSEKCRDDYKNKMA